MRRFTLLIFPFILLAAVAVHAQSDAPAPLPGDITEIRITTSRASIRACPTTACETITTYSIDTPLFVLGAEESEAVQGSPTWYRVRDTLTGAEGYVSDVLTAPAQLADWQLRPVYPTTVSDAMREVYRRGLESGNDPNAFSKTGDCQNVTPYFLAPLADEANYSLGVWSPLQDTIDHFEGSFDRVSAAVDNGYNVASVLSARWANRQICERGETPLECEERLHNPSIVIINMETWWQERPAEEYEQYLSEIVEFWLEQGVVPIVGTKADNLEGDHAINAAVVRVADKYEIPLWNFWLAVQQIPNHGLTEDGFHLTFARDFYDDPIRLEAGWAVRNLTALEAIDAVYRALNEDA